tara:strand:- start:536 stop:688 length:153 start_codon:yes stop_codon:yes gene_type:complete
MSDIITTSDLGVKDNSKLSTGNTRRKYNTKKKKKKKLSFKMANNKYKAGV